MSVRYMIGYQYYPGDAHRLALLSDAVYADDEEARNAAKILGAEATDFFQHKGTEILIAKFDQDVFVTFRGTEPDNVRDLFTDARVLLVKSEGITGAVHAGFASSVENVFIEMIESISFLLEPDGFVYFGGHSKGGGEALIAAKRFNEFYAAKDAGIDHAVVSVHVFGAPAVGGVEFARSYNESQVGRRTFCHVHRSDLIARSPIILRALKTYRTVGREVYHLGNGQGRTFRPNPIRRFIDRCRSFSRRRWRSDHSIEHYIEGTRK